MLIYSGHIPKIVFGLWAMFWHRHCSLSGGLTSGTFALKNVFSKNPESYLIPYAPTIKSEALFSHQFMYVFILNISPSVSPS